MEGSIWDHDLGPEEADAALFWMLELIASPVVCHIHEIHHIFQLFRELLYIFAEIEKYLKGLNGPKEALQEIELSFQTPGQLYLGKQCVFDAFK